MPRTMSDLNFITFRDGSVYAEVNTGNNRKPAFITAQGFISWAEHQLTICPGSKLAHVVLANNGEFTLKQYTDLSLVESHSLRLRLLRQAAAGTVVNSMSRLQGDYNKLVDSLKHV